MREQIVRLQRKMKEAGIDVFLVSDSDEHLSEYVSEHFRTLEEFSGFTGGDGKLVVTADRAALWTDGRYFIQAEIELEGSGIELMKMGEPGTPTMADWILAMLPAGGTLGFDGRCISFREGEALAGVLARSGGRIITDRDLCGEIWEERPPEKVTPCWILPDKYAGRSAAEKLAELGDKVRKAGADVHVVTTNDDIAWLLNLRADDIPNNPIFMAYLLLKSAVGGASGSGSAPTFPECDRAAADEVLLYTDGGHITPQVREYLEALGVQVLPYHQIFDDLKALGGDGSLPGAGASAPGAAAPSAGSVACQCSRRVLLDKKRCSYAIVSSLPDTVGIVDRMNPAMEAKCCKNPAEREGIRIAQHKDSLALTRFMYWFKTEGLRMAAEAESAEARAQSGDTESGGTADGGTESTEALPGLTEWAAAQKLHEFRAAGESFLDESFPTISAYGANAAMAHYMPSPDPDKEVRIRPRGLYLVDSGGQYPEGTTDVTRTWSCGPLTKEEKEAVTLAAVANLRLADARFLEGTSGTVLDYPAREVFWRRGLNYNHGTGHGVGHCLNVHEGPVGIRYKAAGAEAAWPLKEGMYVSDEPGLYVQDRFGVRIENMLLVEHDYTNEYGRFMRFKTMTFCPIDRDCLDPDCMTDGDICLLNRYHERVYRELAEELPEQEKLWLAQMCRPVLKPPHGEAI